VEENVDLKHTGAVLKGLFSRNDYRGTRTMGYPSSFFQDHPPCRDPACLLPGWDWQHSTSHVLVLDDSVEMEIGFTSLCLVSGRHITSMAATSQAMSTSTI
jgi:oligosaccharyltransferase complex subunit alpha (ribophorin I)